MKKTKTNQDLMSAKEFAEHRGVTPSCVTKWKGKKLLFLKNGRIDVAASDAVLDAMEQGFEDGREPKNFNEAQFMKEIYLAKMRRLEYLQKSGELVEVATVKDTLTDIFTQHRDALLTIPERLSAVLALLTDQAKVHTTLASEIRTHLEGLANALESN